MLNKEFPWGFSIYSSTNTESVGVDVLMRNCVPRLLIVWNYVPVTAGETRFHWQVKYKDCRYFYYTAQRASFSSVKLMKQKWIESESRRYCGHGVSKFEIRMLL